MCYVYFVVNKSVDDLIDILKQELEDLQSEITNELINLDIKEFKQKLLCCLLEPQYLKCLMIPLNSDVENVLELFSSINDCWNILDIDLLESLIN